ncbi:putative acetyl-CoA acyltransferase B [Cardiosporidium cionae]|nr:acetyl-CoA acyltransferase 1 [Cardiosporidium cionae]KAF8823051.1 putative acetyl-CoA acyltransferase B [Cardiosporidium cionae]|eukprot:KAF8823051.1 putative acetyl-CoA acyltransferase B [Cardiosporidium cionae]
MFHPNVIDIYSIHWYALQILHKVPFSKRSSRIQTMKRFQQISNQIKAPAFSSSDANDSHLSTKTADKKFSDSSPFYGRPWDHPIRTAGPTMASENDVILCCAIRTPITKAKRGALKDALPEDLLLPLFEAVIKRTGVEPSLIQDICIGNVLQPGAGALSSRIAQLMANLSESTAVSTVNRQCSSGLQAVANIAGAIHSGFIDIGLAGGVESMTNFDMMNSMTPEKLSEKVFQHEQARNCLIPMGITSENVAEKFGISRIVQDQFAMESHRKAARAARLGLFDEEMIPVVIKGNDDFETVVQKDDGIREATTLAQLQKLKPSFKEDGSTHAGNSSQVSDGAALCLLARRSTAMKYGLPMLAKFVDFAVIGVPPEIMGIGPSVAIPAVLSKAGLAIGDIDIFEINEAFASQAVYCIEKLEVPRHKLNPKGGAIAFGHPLGCTGARQIATLLPELRRNRDRYGIVSMCIGTGMGAAAIIENIL